MLGGVLTDYVHWTMIFWINLPLGLVALWMTDRALKKLPRNDRPHRLDVLGAALMVCAALALMLAMTWGGTRYRLGLGADPGPARGGSAVLWLLFALRVATAPEPFIPLAVLREPMVGAIARRRASSASASSSGCRSSCRSISSWCWAFRRAARAPR